MILNKKLLLIISFLSICSAFLSANPRSKSGISFPTQPTTLKKALNQISAQTGCVFSYDPTILNENQPVQLKQRTGLTLESALKQILPSSVYFKLKGKFVLLLKTKTAPAVVVTKPVVPKTLPAEPVRVLPVPPVETKPESVVRQPKADTVKIPIVEQKPIAEVPLTKDTVTERKVDTIQAPVLTPVVSPKKRQPIFALDFSMNRQQSSLGINLGYHRWYALAALGADYYQTYRLGLGLGWRVIDRSFGGADLELIRNSLVAGESYRLHVRGALNQLTAKFHVTLFHRIKLFAGPALFYANYRYQSSSLTQNMGHRAGINAIFGLKFDFLPHN